MGPADVVAALLVDLLKDLLREPTQKDFALVGP